MNGSTDSADIVIELIVFKYYLVINARQKHRGLDNKLLFQMFKLHFWVHVVQIMNISHHLCFILNHELKETVFYKVEKVRLISRVIEFLVVGINS